MVHLSPKVPRFHSGSSSLSLKLFHVDLPSWTRFLLGYISFFYFSEHVQGLASLLEIISADRCLLQMPSRSLLRLPGMCPDTVRLSSPLILATRRFKLASPLETRRDENDPLHAEISPGMVPNATQFGIPFVMLAQVKMLL